LNSPWQVHPLINPQSQGWTDFYRVLMALFKFLNPFLEAASFHQASRILFKGALRILLVILKDFPEFLVEHYIGLCAAIPAHCIQLRNVVLCAFPRGVTLRLDVNSLSEVPPLPEFNQVPDIRTDYVRFLEDAQIRQAVDRYIADETPNPAALVPELRNRIAISVAESDGSPGVKYNLTLLYSLSLYLGSSAVNRSIERNGRVTFDPQGPEVGLLTSLIASLDGEGEFAEQSKSSFQQADNPPAALYQVNITLSIRLSTNSDTPTPIPSSSCSTFSTYSPLLRRTATCPNVSPGSCSRGCWPSALTLGV
jgi:CCR4-NOT transcription complex subunit 1